MTGKFKVTYRFFDDEETQTMAVSPETTAQEFVDIAKQLGDRNDVSVVWANQRSAHPTTRLSEFSTNTIYTFAPNDWVPGEIDKTIEFSLYSTNSMETMTSPITVRLNPALTAEEMIMNLLPTLKNPKPEDVHLYISGGIPFTATSYKAIHDIFDPPTHKLYAVIEAPIEPDFLQKIKCLSIISTYDFPERNSFIGALSIVSCFAPVVTIAFNVQLTLLPHVLYPIFKSIDADPLVAATLLITYLYIDCPEFTDISAHWSSTYGCCFWTPDFLNPSQTPVRFAPGELRKQNAFLLQAPFACPRIHRPTIFERAGKALVAVPNGATITLIPDIGVTGPTANRVQMNRYALVTFPRYDELINEAKINQVVCFLIDQSLPCEVVQQYTTVLGHAMYPFRPTTLITIKSYDKIIEMPALFPAKLETLIPPVVSANHATFDAIWDTCQFLIAAMTNENGNVYYNATPRLILMTSGQNAGSTISAPAIGQALADNKIVMDVILLGESQELCDLSHLSRGVCIRADQTPELIEKEAFVNIDYRAFICAPDSYDVKVPNISETAPTKARPVQHAKRLMVEFQETLGVDQDVLRVSLTTPDDLSQWVVWMKGPDDYLDKWFKMTITFPEDYPRKPPMFRFLTVPYHANINSEGRICLNLLDCEYKQDDIVISLIYAIRVLLQAPNFEDVITSDKKIGISDPDAYLAKVRESAQQFGVDSPP